MNLFANTGTGKFVKNEVESGLYQTTSEVVRAGIQVNHVYHGVQDIEALFDEG